MFQSNFTDSGLEFAELATSRNEAKSISNEMRAVADDFMKDVIEFLEEENPQSDIKEANLTIHVKSWGGKECRGSN